MLRFEYTDQLFASIVINSLEQPTNRMCSRTSFYFYIFLLILHQRMMMCTMLKCNSMAIITRYGIINTVQQHVFCRFTLNQNHQRGIYSLASVLFCKMLRPMHLWFITFSKIIKKNKNNEKNKTERISTISPIRSTDNSINSIHKI